MCCVGLPFPFYELKSTDHDTFSKVIGKGRVCGASQVAHQAGAYPGF